MSAVSMVRTKFRSCHVNGLSADHFHQFQEVGNMWGFLAQHDFRGHAWEQAEDL